MAAVQNVLVVGGGAVGAATATLLADAGVSVDLVEITPDVTALGSGITLQGNALRVLRQLGVLDECLALGYAADQLVIRAPDPAGTVVARVAEHRSGGPDLPASMGMYRPDLARVLVGRAERAGVEVRFSTTLQELTQDDSGVDVRFTDGSTGRYDLVVGADGLRSWTRRLLDVPLETRSVGMGIWRVFAPRPAEVVSSEAVYGGPCYIAGYTPTSEESLYAFLVEDAQDRTTVTDEEKLAIVRRLAGAYGGPWREILASIDDPSAIHYTWFEEHLLDAPWHRGRVVLVGDAVHTCPPTLAQGAALGLEDAAVLAEVLTGADDLDDDLLAGFAARRLPRVREVVEASLQLARWQLAHEQGDVPALMGRIAQLTSAPA
ncbi:2-polyprenyl-6-methoxyphenol hydroxylase [Geodermatophilus amargosae]|uniref:2-polyprenyl-6-methoxyphenol hydroxylase n=1 Tax=Geodermatophilus amargosae TaxID=1296565 RepID=A0A1I7D7E2_9ACTN|nr:FAD-dependent monooxygenase [Geodermatophilus amargosae]SFU07653.1 2-polyprenyl-6-methoxyphenol hydroxylase [Geodermatophilus amargosae]